MGAHEAFLRADALDRTGELGASLRLSTLGGPAPATAPPAYVRALFDQYAAGFDDHLVAGLTYRGPERLIAAMECACATLDRAFEFNRAIDLGCGTGLMAAALKDHVRSIIGVDLSPRMIEVAKAAGFYDQLRIDDLEPFLATQPAASSDLMIAADVFVYVGDLDGIFAQCARVIEPGGVFAFTVQRADGAGWALGHDMRFFHSEDYLRTLAASHGFSTVEMEDLSSRKDAGVDVPGLVAVLARS
jgi:predicted TPR repeat methyltransferase